MKPLPENILNKMSATDRRAIGQQTIEEASDKFHARIEREEDKTFSRWLSLHEIPCLRANPSKRSTIMVGWPDYTIFWDGDVLFIELKSPGKTLRPEQDKVCKKLAEQGFAVFVCHNAEEATGRVRDWMDLTEFSYRPTCEECGKPITDDMQICLDCGQRNQDTEDSVNDYLNERS